MTGADLLPATVLKRKAVVYVRQSTQTQVQTNLESQRRQYDLVDEARTGASFACLRLCAISNGPAPYASKRIWHWSSAKLGFRLH